ncbi:MAG: fasciclin domain-containing protein [Notoacmeibacter sp.]|nr:fasciclin domain-containing protein [Notoacmeibacter sp.]
MRKFAFAATLSLASMAAAPALAGNIVETAKGAGNFTTLLAAAEAAGLAEALATGENLTVFAPTDEAFAKLPAGTVEDLLKPENKGKLAAILQYHVVPSKIMAGDIADGTAEVKTLKAEGDMTIEVTKNADGVMVDGAKVVAADVAADNGVIHVIDTVILPQD